MALMTRTAIMRLLSKIMESGGMTEDMENAIAKLRDDFDEREGILKKYGETYDGEDSETYEWKERDGGTVYKSQEDEKDWKKEYTDLQKRYLNRFFGVVPESARVEDEMYRDSDTISTEGEAITEEPKTLDELIYEEEE